MWRGEEGGGTTGRRTASEGSSVVAIREKSGLYRKGGGGGIGGKVGNSRLEWCCVLSVSLSLSSMCRSPYRLGAPGPYRLGAPGMWCRQIGHEGLSNVNHVLIQCEWNSCAHGVQ